MKKLLTITLITAFLFTGLAFAKSYKVKSKNNEVKERGKVKVEETITTTEKRELTLDWINYTIGSITAEMVKLQESLDEYTALRDAVQIEADKVTLKPEPEPVPPVE